MKRLSLLVALAATGCSNAPVAGFLDNCFPSKARADSAPDPKPNPGPVPGPAPDPRPGPAPGPRPDVTPIPPPDFGPGGP